MINATLLIDHLFIVLLFIVQPIFGWINYQRFIRRVQAGNAPERSRVYAGTMLVEWLALALLLFAWWKLGRPYELLGMHGAIGAGFWIVLIVGLAALGWLVYSGRDIVDMPQDDRVGLRQSLGDMRHFLPQSDGELKTFYGLSVTAGVVEEIVYRGFVIWYLLNFMPVPAAILVSSIAFGFGHSYQGPSGILKTGVVGLVFAVLFMISGSIWLPILLHALFDIIQGRQIREVFRDVPSDNDRITESS